MWAGWSRDWCFVHNQLVWLARPSPLGWTSKHTSNHKWTRWLWQHEIYIYAPFLLLVLVRHGVFPDQCTYVCVWTPTPPPTGPFCHGTINSWIVTNIGIHTGYPSVLKLECLNTSFCPNFFLHACVPNTFPKTIPSTMLVSLGLKASGCLQAEDKSTYICIPHCMLGQVVPDWLALYYTYHLLYIVSESLNQHFLPHVCMYLHACAPNMVVEQNKSINGLTRTIHMYACNQLLTFTHQVKTDTFEFVFFCLVSFYVKDWLIRVFYGSA